VSFDEEFLDKQFVRLAINHNLDEYVADAQGGVGLAHITKKKFDASRLRICPMAEQKRIVARIEALLERVNKARERLDPVLQIRSLPCSSVTLARRSSPSRNRGPIVSTACRLPPPSPVGGVTCFQQLRKLTCYPAHSRAIRSISTLPGAHSRKG
jgi:hypothetical protein